MTEDLVYTVEELKLLNEILLKNNRQDYVICDSDEETFGKFYNKNSKYHSLSEQGYLYLKNPELAKALAKKYGAPIPMES
jgi:hypothetical protein